MVSWCKKWNIMHKYPQNQSYVGSRGQTLTTNVSMGESLHCALLLDYVPPEEPLGTPLGNALRIR